MEAVRLPFGLEPNSTIVKDSFKLQWVSLRELGRETGEDMLYSEHVRP